MQANLCLPIDQFSGYQADLKPKTSENLRNESQDGSFLAMLKSFREADGSLQSDYAEQTARQEKADRSEYTERQEYAAHTAHTDCTDRIEHPERTERTEENAHETQKTQDDTHEKGEVAVKEKKEARPDSEKEKVGEKNNGSRDPLIAAALGAKNAVNAAAAERPESVGKNARLSKNARADNSIKVNGGDKNAKKIDPKQLEFLKKVSGHENEIELDADFFEEAGLVAESGAGGHGAEGVLASMNAMRGLETAAADGGIEEGGVNALTSVAGGINGAHQAEKGSNLRGGDAKITVRDLRTKVLNSNKKAGAADAKNGAFALDEKGDVKDIKKNFITSIRQGADGNLEMTLDLNQGAEKNILSMDGQSAAADGSTFQAMLKNQVTQNAADFVKAGNIVLRDNNQGQINLILHPESLGNVKISLDMNGKVVQGHIIVASREAMNAFNESADALKNAFIQSGFEGAEFDVSYSQSQMNFAQGQGENGENARQQAALEAGRKIYGDFVSETINSGFNLSDNFNSAGDYGVNIVA